MLVSGKGCKIHVSIAGWGVFAQARQEVRERGSNIAISNWLKPRPGCVPFASKASGLYMMSTLVKNDATLKGFDDAIMLDTDGNITEATTSNIFFIKAEQLITPTPDCFLDGITRQAVIKIASECGIDVIQRHIKPQELGEFHGAFLTGTAIEIMPVSSITCKEAKFPFDPQHQKLLEISRLYAERVRQHSTATRL